MKIFWVVDFCVSLLLLAITASGHVVLIGKNVTLSFDDIEANFASSIKGSAKSGKLYVAEPLDACSVLVNKVDARKNGTSSPYVLIIRGGGCSFEDKVRKAQTAGFKAAIVYDYEYGDLVSMAGNSDGIKIAAVFVSKVSGETLAKYAGVDAVQVWIVPGYENSAWSIMAISFISLLAMSAMLAMCFFVRRNRVIRRSVHASIVRDFHGMSRRLVKAMPSLIFTEAVEDNSTSGTCAICLEDYNVGEMLRILPCCHKFHALCVDFWLTSRRTFCPVCKRDARSSNGGPQASESTPLLASRSSSSTASSSFRSSLAASPPILINAASYRSSSASRPESLHLNGSRSSTDLRNASSSQRSRGSSYMTNSTNSLVYLNSRHLSPYIPQSSPGTASSSYLGSSSQHHHPYPLHYSESATSFSPYASAQSLPRC